MKKGFSILEVVIFIAIFGVFFTTVTAVVGTSIRAIKFNEQKILATHYGDELLEWVRGEREKDWQIFKNTYSGTGSGKFWCFNDSEISNWPSQGACPITGSEAYDLNKTFNRQANLIYDGTDKVTILITVNWVEGNEIRSVKVNSIVSVFD